MQTVRKDGVFSSPFADIIKAGEEKMKKLEQEKERLLQKILFEWNQVKSIVFWRQCFQAVEFRVIRSTYSNVKQLISGGYEINNPAAFFVHSLKKMGYYPFQEVVKDVDEERRTA